MAAAALRFCLLMLLLVALLSSAKARVSLPASGCDQPGSYNDGHVFNSGCLADHYCPGPPACKMIACPSNAPISPRGSSSVYNCD